MRSATEMVQGGLPRRPTTKPQLQASGLSAALIAILPRSLPEHRALTEQERFATRSEVRILGRIRGTFGSETELFLGFMVVSRFFVFS